MFISDVVLNESSFSVLITIDVVVSRVSVVFILTEKEFLRETEFETIYTFFFRFSFLLNADADCKMLRTLLFSLDKMRTIVWKNGSPANWGGVGRVNERLAPQTLKWRLKQWYVV